jgi:hypothetical protein
VRKILFIITFFNAFCGLAQKRISFTYSNLPIFINKSGDTLNKALVGGLNQPQFQAIDINNDGKKDLLVHDRSGGMILPFINNGNKDITTFHYSPNYVSTFPKMDNTWFLLVDYDKDGKEDLWTTIKFRPTLFRNVTNPGDSRVNFIQTSPRLMAYNFGTSPFDSVTVSSDNFNIPTIADVDGDGDVDMFSYQANEGSLLLYRNMTVDFKLPLHPPVFDLADYCWGSFRDTTFDQVKVFPCPLKFYRKKHSGGSNLLWLDNDGDGDMDLLMGNQSAKNLIYLKNGKSDFGLKRDSIVGYDGYWPIGQEVVNSNSFPGAYLLDANGDDMKDILVAPNATDKIDPIDEIEQVWFYKNTGTNSKPVFEFGKKNYFTDEILDHGSYADPLLYDIDSDDDLDIIIAANGNNAKTRHKNDRLFYYKNIGNKNRPVFKLEDEDLWGLSIDSIKMLSICIGDIDGDTKPDVIAGNSMGSLSFYKNISTDTAWKLAAPVKNYNSIKVSASSTPQIIDLDKDGLQDLVIGGYNGIYKYFRNTGSKASPKYSLSDDTLGNFFIHEILLYGTDTNPVYHWIGDAKGVIADLDNDGKPELVSGGYEGKLKFYKFNTYNQKKYLEDTTILFDSATMRTNTLDFGTQSRPAIGDLDGDGINDIVVGNNRGGIHFLKGSMVKAKVKEISRQREPSVFPNPNNGNLLTITKPSKQSFTFSLFDLSGQLLQTEVSAVGIETHQMKLNIHGEGIFILRSTGMDNVSFYNRVIVLKGN